jgi:hypothetical protein
MRTTLNFLLYDWLRVETLSERQRFEDHSRATFEAVLDTSERIAWLTLKSHSSMVSVSGCLRQRRLQ